MEKVPALSRSTSAATPEISQIPAGEQAVSRRNHHHRTHCDRHGRVDDVPRSHDLLRSKPIFLHRLDLGFRLRVTRAVWRWPDRVVGCARLLRNSTREASDHQIDDLRLDGPCFLLEALRSGAMADRDPEFILTW